MWLDPISWALPGKLQDDPHLDRVLENGSRSATAIRPESHKIKGEESLLPEVEAGVAQQLRIIAAIRFPSQSTDRACVILRGLDPAVKTE